MGSITYSYSSTQNNGQITQATDNISHETIVYQYDALKRLTSASSTPQSGYSTSAWTETFQYDGFGNLTAKVLNGTTQAIAVTAATNRLTSANYDANGNMTSGAGGTFGYDGAKRMVSAVETGGGAEYYSYAPDNKRIYRQKVNGGTVTEEWTFWGMMGEKLASGTNPISWGNQSVYFAGKLIMEGNAPVFQDRLGTNRAGSARYLPYGEEVGTASANDRQKFATYNRDSYTGLDYADQRFYASTYGRFNTADPFMASGGPSDPASWNRYSYTRGDPVGRYDPTGLWDIGCDPFFDESCEWFSGFSSGGWGNPNVMTPGCGWIGASFSSNPLCAIPSDIVLYIPPPTPGPAPIPTPVPTPGPAPGPEQTASGGPLDCGAALAELVAATGTVLRRISENVIPDPGHNKALQQAVNRLNNAIDRVRRSCMSLAAAAAAVAAAEAAVTAAAPYLLIGAIA